MHVDVSLNVVSRTEFGVYAAVTGPEAKHGQPKANIGKIAKKKGKVLNALVPPALA